MKCDCLNCSTIATWKQEFVIDGKMTIVDLCKGHHNVLRFRIPIDRSLNGDVLKWLLIQPSNFRKVVKYDLFVSLRSIAEKAVKNKRIDEEGIING